MLFILCAFWYFLLSWVWNKVRKDPLIDSSFWKVKDGYLMDTVSGTQKIRGREAEGKMDEKTTQRKLREREREINTSDGAFWNCLVPSLLIMFHISLCGGVFWKWLFASCCDWNNNDGVFVFLLHLQKKKRNTGTCFCIAGDTQSRPQHEKQHCGICSLVWSWHFLAAQISGCTAVTASRVCSSFTGKCEKFRLEPFSDGNMMAVLVCWRNCLFILNKIQI